jgi:hypothetical protein
VTVPTTADQPPTGNARRVALMFATPGFAALPGTPAYMALALKASTNGSTGGRASVISRPGCAGRATTSISLCTSRKG